MLMLEDGTKLLSDLERVDQLTAADVQAVAATTFREEWSIHWLHAGGRPCNRQEEEHCLAVLLTRKHSQAPVNVLAYVLQLVCKQ